MKSYTLTFQDQPLFTAKTWHEVAQAALNAGLATYAYKCLFVLVPGAKIRS